MAKLKELKAQFGEGVVPANGPTPAKGGGGGTTGGGGGGGKLILKTAKGTRDYQPAQMAVREKVAFYFIISCLPTENSSILVLMMYFLLNWQYLVSTKSLLSRNFSLHKCS